MKGIHVNTIDKKDIIEPCEHKRVKNLNLTNMYLFLNHKCPCMYMSTSHPKMTIHNSNQMSIIKISSFTGCSI